MLGLSFAGWLGTILFIVLVYDIIKNYQGSTAVENATFKGGVGLIHALEGK